MGVFSDIQAKKKPKPNLTDGSSFTKATLLLI